MKAKRRVSRDELPPTAREDEVLAAEPSKGVSLEDGVGAAIMAAALPPPPPRKPFLVKATRGPPPSRPPLAAKPRSPLPALPVAERTPLPPAGMWPAAEAASALKRLWRKERSLAQRVSLMAMPSTSVMYLRTSRTHSL